MVESHYNVQPVIDIFASSKIRDLGAVAKDINKLIKRNAKDVPKGHKLWHADKCKHNSKPLMAYMRAYFFHFIGLFVDRC